MEHSQQSAIVITTLPLIHTPDLRTECVQCARAPYRQDPGPVPASCKAPTMQHPPTSAALPDAPTHAAAVLPAGARRSPPHCAACCWSVAAAATRQNANSTTALVQAPQRLHVSVPLTHAHVLLAPCAGSRSHSPHQSSLVVLPHSLSTSSLGHMTPSSAQLSHADAACRQRFAGQVAALPINDPKPDPQLPTVSAWRCWLSVPRVLCRAHVQRMVDARSRACAAHQLPPAAATPSRPRQTFVAAIQRGRFHGRRTACAHASLDEQQSWLPRCWACIDEASWC